MRDEGDTCCRGGCGRRFDGVALDGNCFGPNRVSICGGWRSCVRSAGRDGPGTKRAAWRKPDATTRRASTWTGHPL